MTQFPHIHPDGEWLTLAGDITYTPRIRFDDAVMEHLQAIIEHYYSPEGCENPDILADFLECQRNQQGQITHRSEIILYRDGGDWAEEEDGKWSDIGLLFARRDIDQATSTVTYRVHLPPDETQNQLLSAAGDLISSLKQGNYTPLRLVQAYLTSVINVADKWYELSKFPFLEED